MKLEEIEKLADLANLKGIAEITFGEAGQIYNIKFSGKAEPSGNVVSLPTEQAQAETETTPPPEPSPYDIAMARLMSQAVEME